MPTPTAAILAEIHSRISGIAAKRDAAEARIRSLETELADTKAELADTKAELHKARLDAEYLTLSHRLADSPEALLTARHLLASLIRKVDSAINLVKNDPADET